ncbi:MAG: hypothetical protein KIS92_11025 [Planctomycetota bacterium]|nr:hypothetical protein [Planctomycetota bacterium]
MVSALHVAWLTGCSSGTQTPGPQKPTGEPASEAKKWQHQQVLGLGVSAPSAFSESKDEQLTPDSGWDRIEVSEAKGERGDVVIVYRLTPHDTQKPMSLMALAMAYMTLRSKTLGAKKVDPPSLIGKGSLGSVEFFACRTQFSTGCLDVMAICDGVKIWVVLAGETGTPADKATDIREVVKSVTIGDQRLIRE